MEWKQLAGEQKNFVFLGEAGCGKSEIAMNLACALAEQDGRKVHFFDLDMTKPLFRSRDLAQRLEQAGVRVHFEEQFMDAPTVTGGVMRLLRDPEAYVIMDVGGDYIGARSIGGYAPLLNAASTVVYYIINSYRAWSMDIDHIDQVLGPHPAGKYPADRQLQPGYSHQRRGCDPGNRKGSADRRRVQRDRVPLRLGKAAFGGDGSGSLAPREAVSDLPLGTGRTA